MSETVVHQRPAGPAARLGTALRAVFAPPAGTPERTPPAAGGQHRHEAALAVLTAARGVIRRGWAQNTWYVVETRAGRRRAFPPVLPSRLDHTRVVQACLVGAVVHAAWQQSARPERAYPAIDALWQTLLNGGDRPGAEPVGPLCPPPVRAARVRDLTTWNDRPHRTKDEVLHLLERTAARIAGA
jgi:hypothetical protein